MRKSLYINEIICESEDQSLFELTHQEIADELKVERGGVSQIEKRAMKKFKAILREKGYTLEDFLGESK